MKRIIIAIIFLLVLLIGCLRTTGLTNDQIIQETLKCERAGLKAKIIDNNMGGVDILCIPKESPCQK
ncbi:MAG: hypothetical protein WC373_17190 [Smithella sp.]|jgi:hypothetical protein